MTTHIGLSLGHRSTSEAEHWLSTLAQPVLVACTHLVRDPYPHVALSVETVLPAAFAAPSDDLVEAARWSADQHRSRLSGRAFRYPGMALLTGEMTVAEILAVSAIEAITVLTSDSPPEQDTIVNTREFVRPQWMNGKLTLVTLPEGDNRVAPFEVANPMDCCQDHF